MKSSPPAADAQLERLVAAAHPDEALRRGRGGQHDGDAFFEEAEGRDRVVVEAAQLPHDGGVRDPEVERLGGLAARRRDRGLQPINQPLVSPDSQSPKFR